MSIKIGQVYRDNDPRTPREVKVPEVYRIGDRPANVRIINTATKRQTVVRAGAFGSRARTGFTLVKDVLTDGGEAS